MNKEEIANKFKERKEADFTPNISNKPILHELSKFWFEGNNFKSKRFSKITQSEVLLKLNNLKPQKNTWSLWNN